MGQKTGQKVSIITYLIHMVCKRLAENTSHYEYIFTGIRGSQESGCNIFSKPTFLCLF